MHGSVVLGTAWRQTIAGTYCLNKMISVIGVLIRCHHILHAKSFRKMKHVLFAHFNGVVQTLPFPFPDTTIEDNETFPRIFLFQEVHFIIPINLGRLGTCFRFNLGPGQIHIDLLNFVAEASPP